MSACSSRHLLTDSQFGLDTAKLDISGADQSRTKDSLIPQAAINFVNFGNEFRQHGLWIANMTRDLRLQHDSNC